MNRVVFRLSPLLRNARFRDRRAPSWRVLSRRRPTSYSHRQRRRYGRQVTRPPAGGTHDIRHLTRLRRRFEQFRSSDKLYNDVLGAQIAMQDLCAELQYRSCEHGVGQFYDVAIVDSLKGTQFAAGSTTSVSGATTGSPRSIAWHWGQGIFSPLPGNIPRSRSRSISGHSVCQW
jgi:hypothetical protein